ncbi:hypothetical protein BD311DRAFT_270615 [Dichomitus squalens]|uniref:Uncharacterized protein n=1 Tax=Dichomitus squalens TaxID=114155 RepID=A0A4Q9MS82_9APHY|nr:hypothetical protein BD311DRAFT_270615 [Dichomitus squalens]
MLHWKCPIGEGSVWKRHCQTYTSKTTGSIDVIRPFWYPVVKRRAMEIQEHVNEYFTSSSIFYILKKIVEKLQRCTSSGRHIFLRPYNRSPYPLHPLHQAMLPSHSEPSAPPGTEINDLALSITRWCAGSLANATLQIGLSCFLHGTLTSMVMVATFLLLCVNSPLH